MHTKPLGHKAYGSIGHLPESRLGPADHSVNQGQARICTVKCRDNHDTVIVQEKLDGSCTAVARINGTLHPLGRAGYPAISSQWRQHQLFDQWVWQHQDRFMAVIQDGERLVGEWLAQAHSTLYDLTNREPWAVFDLIRGQERATTVELDTRLRNSGFHRPTELHYGQAIPVSAALELLERNHWQCDKTEGVVYRVERKGKVDFLAKYVKPDKVDGIYLPGVYGNETGAEVWNWDPTGQ